MAYSGRMKGHTTSLRFIKGVLCAFFVLTVPVYSQQNVGIGTATPDSSAVLELSTQLLSSPKGFLVPRITSAQRNAIALPANGLLIYNTTTNQFEYNTGSAAVPSWISLLNSTFAGGGSGWGLTGNSGTTAGTNFIGTTDAQDLVFKTANTERLRISSGGNMLLKSGATANEFQFFEPSGSGANYTAFKAQAQSANVVYTLPSAYGTPGQVLSTDASGNLSWILAGNVSNATYNNTVDSSALNQYGVLSGGYNNSQSAQSGFVGAGQSNDMTNTATYGAIVSGYSNEISSPKGFIGSGQDNTLTSTATSSAIVGGEQNTVNGIQNFIGAGLSNTINSGASSSSIISGESNALSGSRNFIGSGQSNTINSTGINSFLGAGGSNTLGGTYNFLGGGQQNTIDNTVTAASLAGGYLNRISGNYSAIPGGQNLRLGSLSYGFNTGASVDLSSQSQVAYFGDVDIWIGNTYNTARQLRFYEPNSSSTFTGTNFTAFKAGTQTADLVYTLPTAQGIAGSALINDGSGNLSWSSGTAGTVTSVGLSLPSIFTVSGSPVTSSGTLTGTLASQLQNTVFAAPSSGSGTPGFRTLVAGDIPSLDMSKISTGTLSVSQGGTGASTVTGIIAGNGTSALVGRTLTGTSNQITITNGNGTAGNPTFAIATNPVLPGNASSSGTFTAGTGLTVTSGGATISAGGINITGGLTVGTGTTTLSPLSTGIVHSSSTGVLSSSPVALATGDVSGILPVANGGTNSSTALNNNRIMVSNAGSIREAAALTNGQLLIGSTGAAPVAANITGTLSQLDVTNGAGTIGLKLSDNSILPGTGSVTIPSGTTATRPASPTNGMMRYNTTTGKFEFYQGNTWVNPLGASLSGGGTVNYLPKYNESTTLGNSNVYDNGTTVSIGNTSPTGTAALEVTSTTKGFLMPRMTEAQRDAIASPATGLMVYCTNGDQPGINYFDGVEWTRMIVENAPGSVHVVNKTSDQTGSGSMANDTYLFAPVGAYETWVIDGVIHVEAPTNQSIVIAFTHPTGASMKVGYHANTATANLQTGIITTSGATESISIKAGEPLVVFVKAVVIGQATAGNFQFTWNAPSSVTVKASSFFITSQGQ